MRTSEQIQQYRFDQFGEYRIYHNICATIEIRDAERRVVEYRYDHTSIREVYSRYMHAHRVRQSVRHITNMKSHMGNLRVKNERTGQWLTEQQIEALPNWIPGTPEPKPGTIQPSADQKGQFQLF